MNNINSTGLIDDIISDTLNDIVYYHEKQNFDFLFNSQILIDKAYTCILYKAGYINQTTLFKILDILTNKILDLYEKIKNNPQPRGFYLAYEKSIINFVKDPNIQNIHLGRSRNDLSATIWAMTCRNNLRNLLKKLKIFIITCQEAYIQNGKQLLPQYTHHQAAYPITYGHLLKSIILGFEDAINIALLTFKAISVLPLGGAAGGGTSVNLNMQLCATWLGFSSPHNNSIFGVGARHGAALAIECALSISRSINRAVQDVLLLASSGINIIKFPDNLVGSSSAMPQKRNPFMLEHIQGLYAKVIGHYTTFESTSLQSGVGNSIPFNIYGVNSVIQSITETEKQITLFNAHIAGLNFNINRCDEILQKEGTYASVLAEQLVLSDQMNFREAHHYVGLSLKNNTTVKNNILNHNDLSSFIKFGGSAWSAYNNKDDSFFSDYIYNIQDIIDNVNSLEESGLNLLNKEIKTLLNK